MHLPCMKRTEDEKREQGEARTCEQSGSIHYQRHGSKESKRRMRSASYWTMGIHCWGPWSSFALPLCGRNAGEEAEIQ